MYQNIITTLIKVFFIGLVLQFFLFNLVTFSLWIDASWMKVVRLWKEIVLVTLWGIAIAWIIRKKDWKILFPNKEIIAILFLLICTIGITSWWNYAIHQWSRWTYALASKYDFIGFFILLIGYFCTHFIEKNSRKKLIRRYGRLLKIMLLWGLLRYLIIFIKPGILKLFWYDNFIYEGTVWGKAPAAYYTHINQWLPRNQFLFERPISRWFFLTALRPFFYYMFLYKRKLSETWGRRAIYAINIITTFSRAARWSRIGEIIIIWILGQKNKKELISFWLKTLLPILCVFGLVGYQRYYDIFARQYSNTGHVMMLKKWIDMSIEKPVRWHWPWSAWPASHRDPDAEWFNPENQFVQVFVEFWASWFIPRMLLFCYLCLIGILPELQRSFNAKKEMNSSNADSREEKDSETAYIWDWIQQIHHEATLFSSLLLSMSVWLIWLAASWMVLHSFTDRMIVYPFMMLFWIILYTTQAKKWLIPWSWNSKS